MPSPEVRRDPFARALLGALCLALGIEATINPAHGSAVADSRTYIEMTAGVVKNAVPYLDNGPVGMYPGLQAPWNVVSHGHLWGMYAPLYPYVAAPSLWAGGLRAMSIFTALLLVPVALLSFALARSVTGDERAAAYAAVLTVISTPILGKAFEPSPYLLGIGLITGATYAALRAVREARPRCLAYAAASGLLGGLAWASHLVCAPMALALLPVMIFVGRSPDNPSSAPKSPLDWNRTGAEAAAAFTAGLSVCLGPLAFLNSIRFGSWNPLSYGPIPWRAPALTTLTMRDQLFFGLPCFAWMAMVGGGLALRRRRARLAAVVLALAAVMVVADAALRDRLVTMLRLTYAFLFEQAIVPVTGTERVRGTFGAFRGGRLSKSLLQATPVLLVALWARPRDRREREALFVILAPCAGLAAYLLMRANQGIELALGQPYIGLRYTLPPMPMLFAVVMLVARELPLKTAHRIGALVIGVALARYLWVTNNDEALATQVLVAHLPLAAAVVAFALTGWYLRRGGGGWAAAWTVALCAGLGLGVGVGHDYRLSRALQEGLDARADAFAAFAPPSFAVLGNVGELDDVLTLRPTHDVQYADWQEWEDWRDARPLLERWFAEGRPVFLAAAWPPQESPWPDIKFELLNGLHRFYRVTKVP
jgi:hypothetical protein